MIGFTKWQAAEQAAIKLGLAGLTGSGQQCGAVDLPDGSWAYWTAHNYFHPRKEPGNLILPGPPGKGIKLYDLDDEGDCLALLEIYGEELFQSLGL